jgi:hypothetical protein
MVEKGGSASDEGKSVVDWNRVAFPSNRLTLGQLRKSAATDRQTVEVAVHNLLCLEMEVAIDSAASLSGTRRTIGQVAKTLLAEKAKELASHYVRIGLAAGPQEAKQLVARLESSVASATGPESPGHRA